MFRLKEQQLHILMWLMVIASVLFFGFLGLDKALLVEEKRSWKGMEDFSEGWLCTYETSNEEKLAQYRKENSAKNDQETSSAQKDYTIVDVLLLPSTLEVRAETDVVLTRRVPDVKQDTMYVTMELDNASVQVLVEEDIIYSSSPKESMIPVRHIIPILPEYSDLMMSIVITDIADEEIALGKLQAGTYNQLWVSTLQTHGLLVAVGLLLFVIGVSMLVNCLIIKNTWQQKRVLLYAAVEGIVLGVLCILNSELIPLILGWNYGNYILKACTMTIAIVLHLTSIRCFIYKKKVLGIVDVAILLIGVFYISVMVLQAFNLIHFDLIYNMASVLYIVMLVFFTVVLAITIFDYQRKEGLPVFIANVILILCMFVQLIMHLTGKQVGIENIYVCVGFIIYMIYIGIYGMRRAIYVQPKKEETPLDESQIRARVVEHINPNLLFASFQTLQSLIKSGSAKSVKMIYYISVYLRDNLKALENADEVVSFSVEMEHIIAYLQLQKTRNQDMDFAMECKVKDFNIPRHSLEPLVENAVKHGLAKNGNKGNVAIRTYTRADGYAIQIIDDGAGFDMHILKKKSTTLAKKLALLEATCQARTEVISKEGKGTVITIVLPMLDNDLLEEM